MSSLSKFAFGSSATQQIAKRILVYISANFINDVDAAKNLGITRQRLSSYTTAKSFPGAEMIDLFLEKWGLDLIGGKPRVKSPIQRKVQLAIAKQDQMSLFETPMTLTGGGAKVIIRRAGSRLIAVVELTTDLKIA